MAGANARPMSWRVGFLLFACGVLCATQTTWAQTQLPPTLPNPRLLWAFPAGGPRGQTIEVTVGGDDLDDARQLVFDSPGITAVAKLAEPGLGQTGPQPVPGVFKVTIDAGVAPDVYELRVVGKYGLSNPRTFVVGSLPEVNETEPNNSLKQATEVRLGTTINGNSDGPALDYFRFTASKGQRIIIDCQAYRIDSRLDGTLILFDGSGRELDRSHNVNRRDPLIDFSVPADGDYVVALHDHVYGYYTMPGESFYRLTVSTGPYLDFVFPPAGTPGSEAEYTLYGRNLPAGVPAPGVEVGGRPLDMLKVRIKLPAEQATELGRAGGLLVEPSESFVDGLSYRLPAADGTVSNPVLVTMASSPVVVEQEPNDDAGHAASLKLPCEYVGQFYPRGDRDWVSFEAKKGDVFWIDLISQRLGTQTDARLLIQQVKRDQGQEKAVDLQVVDDDMGTADRVHWSFLDSLLFNTMSHDPSCRFVAPDDGLYRVMIQDLSRPSQDLSRPSRGDSRLVYRLCIRPAEPDFRLVAAPRPPTGSPVEASSQPTIWSPAIRRGGNELIEVFAYRRDGFDGEISLSVDNLPPGVTASPTVIARNQPSATIVLKKAEGSDVAGQTVSFSPITIKGRSPVGQSELVRTARMATMVWAVQLTGVTHHRSRLTDQMFVTSINDEVFPYELQIDPNVVLETSYLGTVKFPVNVVRRDKFQGNLDLSVYGLPATIHGPMHAQPKYHTPIDVKGDQAAAEFTIKAPNHVPPGTHSFFVSGVGTVKYAKNPERLKAAEERLTAIEKIVAEEDAQLKAAMQNQAAAAKALADAQAAQQDVKSQTEAKLGADKLVAEADAKFKKDTAFLQTFRQEVTMLREKSKPTDLKISAASNSIRLKITPAPFDLEAVSPRIVVRRGQSVEAPFAIKRLYGNTDPVQVQLLAVYSVTGLSVPPATVAAGESAGKLVVSALAGAPVGTYVTAVQAGATVQGQTLTVKREVTLVIEE